MNRLVCDLGGTGCRMALAKGTTLLPQTYFAVQNADFASFEEIITAYLARFDMLRPASIIAALAAPVSDDEVILSNHHWQLSKSRIGECAGVQRVDFLNDLEALGYALTEPCHLEFRTVGGNLPSGDDKSRLVVGIGTGFNSAARTASGDVICAEAGHITFPRETALDAWLQSHFTKKYGRCSSERVISGSGLLAIYEGICAQATSKPEFSDSHAIISAAKVGDRLADEACREFCQILGRSVGDLALAFMPEGGIWLAGGMSGGLADMIVQPEGPFLAAFKAKGRMETEMSRFPVFLLQDQFAALRGCTIWAEAQVARSERSLLVDLERAQ